MDPLAKQEHVEYQLALSTLCSCVLRCSEKVFQVGDAVPESVRKHTRSKAWHAAAMLEQGATGITAEGAAAVSHAMTHLFSALLDYVEELQRKEQRQQDDLEEAIKAMTKWRAREELQRQKVRELEQERSQDAYTIAELEKQVEDLKRQVELVRAETEHTIRAMASQNLRNSRCASATTVEDLVDRVRSDSTDSCAWSATSASYPRSRSPSGQSRRASFSSKVFDEECEDSQHLEEDDLISERKTDDVASERSGVSIPQHLPKAMIRNEQIDPLVRAAVEKRMYRILEASTSPR